MIIKLPFVLAITLVAVSHNALGILFGTNIYPHIMPHLVFLKITGPNGESRCGGSLISENHVLTAARCLKTATAVTVILGADDLSQPEDDTRVTVDTTPADFKIHEQFNEETLENDIALINLPQAITQTANIKVIPVAKEEDVADIEGKLTIAAGWGLTCCGYPDSLSDVPQAIWIPVLNKDKNGVCDLAFGTKVKDTNICCDTRNSWEAPLNIFIGDWGGPLTLDGKNLLVGVASFTNDTYCFPRPNVFTDVSKYTDWLKTNADI